jgi:hypothetical protein
MIQVADGLNKSVGRELFNGSFEPYSKRPETTVFKLLDCYAKGFLSSSGGVAVFGDLGCDLLKVEAPACDVGLGFRLDTGINFGGQGARVCFVGVGGEVVLVEDAPKDAPAFSRVRGFGLEFWMIKFKVLWK